MTRKSVIGLRRMGLLAVMAATMMVGVGVRPAAAQESPAPADTTLASTAAVPAAGTAVDTATAPAPVRAEAFPRPAVVRKVRLHETSHNVVRTGPGSQYAISGVHPGGSTFPVIAKQGEWFGVLLSPTESGWIHASLCEEFDDLSDLEYRPNPRLYNRTGTYVVTGYGGAYAYDRKSNSALFGGRLGYYVFDRFQVEAGLEYTRVRRPAEIVETLFGLSLEEEQFSMLSYHLNLNFELLPGRQMVPFLTGGVGSSIMLGKSEAGFNVGAGTTLFLSKKTAVRWEFRSVSFDSGPDDARVHNHNAVFAMGTSVLF